MKNFLKQNNKGFTIVETLVAIAILMIAIAGPLTIAQKGLMASVYARDQSVATFLAQDAMEFIKNYRDNNIRVGLDWLDGLDDCLTLNYCSVDTTVGTITNPASSVPLYRTESGFRTTGDARSQFSRKFSVEQLQADTEAKVTVIVSWTTGTIQNVVTIEDYIFNVQL